jgi:hypothetical protein
VSSDATSELLLVAVQGDNCLLCSCSQKDVRICCVPTRILYTSCKTLPLNKILVHVQLSHRILLIGLVNIINLPETGCATVQAVSRRPFNPYSPVQSQTIVYLEYVVHTVSLGQVSVRVLRCSTCSTVPFICHCCCIILALDGQVK